MCSSELKAALKDADELYLATDEDREGEAISWHLLEELKPQVPVKRMVFHEITRPAIEHAVDNWRDIDYGLVDAQETRRIVDRLFGYPVSGVLWRKVNRGLSAGRVQSPAVRLVVERERERIAFVAAGYWDLAAAFPTAPPTTATLVAGRGNQGGLRPRLRHVPGSPTTIECCDGLSKNSSPRGSDRKPLENFGVGFGTQCQLYSIILMRRIARLS